MSDGSSPHVAVPPLTGVVPAADEPVPVPAQPAAARARATTPAAAASVLQRSPDLNLPRCCGGLSGAAAPRHGDPARLCRFMCVPSARACVPLFGNAGDTQAAAPAQWQLVTGCD